MRKKNNLLAFAILVVGIVLIFVSSCKKDDKEDDNNVTPVSTETLTATIGGGSFVAETILRQTAGEKISIMGKVGTQTLDFVLPDTLKTGSYPLINDFFHCYVQYNPTDTEYYMSSSGTIILTEFSKTGKIKGTFNCVVTKVADKVTNINITNGVIDVNY